MNGKLQRAAAAGVEAVLRRQGFDGIELELARRDTIAWLKARRRWVTRRQRSIAGLAVVVATPSRAALRPVERPLAGPGELSVEVLASAVSPGTERGEWLRRPNLRRPLPYTPGYSGAGRVISCGSGPYYVPPGTQVAIARLPHASIATMPAAYASVVPAGVDIESAALVYLAIIAGYGVQRAGPISGKHICVLGAGPIGALAHRMALLEHPASVTIVAASRRREDGARRAGVAHFLTAADALDDLGAHVVIEATGDPRGISSAVAAARPGGTVVLLGSPWDVTPDVPVQTIQRKRLRVVGAHISSLATEAKTLDHDPFRRLADRYLNALADGAFDVDDLVGEAVDPREVQAFYRRLASGDVLAAHLDWTAIPRDERLYTPRFLDLPTLPEKTVPAAARPVASPRPVGRLRFAVVGCGDIGYDNARAIMRATNADLVLLHDPVQSLAVGAATRFGGEAVATLDEAFDRSRVDAVVLSVPHDLHAPLVTRAAEAGLHVLVEKPLAHTLTAARGAATAVARAGVTMSLFLPYRCAIDVVTARALVDAGALGEPVGAAIVFHDDQPDAYWAGGFSGRASSDWRLKRARSGGGVLIMSLIHYIDFIRHILGREIATVHASGLTRPGFEVEDVIAMTATFDNGAVASIVGSTITRGRPPARVEMWGDAGTILLQPEARIFTERAVDGAVANRWCELPGDDGVDFRARFLERFVSAVSEGRAPEVTVDDALALQAVIEAGYRSVELGRPVAVADLLGGTDAN